MTDTEIHQGDKVSWNWGSGQPSGEVAEVKDQGQIAIESHRGNTITKNAEPENPAVHIERSGNDVVKRASELQVDQKAEGANGHQSNGEPKKEDDKQVEPEKEEQKQAEPEKIEEKQPEPGKKEEQQPELQKDDGKPAEVEKQDEVMKDAPPTEEKKEVAPSAEEKREDAQPNGESKAAAPKEDSKVEATAEVKDNEQKAEVPETGTKRKAEDSPVRETNGADANKGEPLSKKTKTDANAEGEGEGQTEGKKGGRPKAGEKREKKEPVRKRQPKKAATADGQPRRSGRNRS